MKIALLAPITNPLPPTSYAPWEQVVHLLATNLTKLGEDVTVFAAKDSNTQLYKIVNTVDTSLVNTSTHKFQQEMMHISIATKLIREGGFDIVNNHVNWNGMLTLDAAGLNHVTTIHGFEEPSKYVFNTFKNRNFISISLSERRKCPDLNYLMNSYNPIDFSFYDLVEEKEAYIFVAARICRDKGIHNAIKLAQSTGIELRIAGQITNREYFDKEVAPHLGDKVKYLGVVSQKDMKALTGKAKAYISLLEWDEPFGLSVAEAIACGTPVIANKRGSMPELVVDGVTGILVDTVDEAIERFSEVDKISPSECREKGKEVFSAEVVAKRYLEVFAKLVNQS